MWHLLLGVSVYKDLSRSTDHRCLCQEAFIQLQRKTFHSLIFWYAGQEEFKAFVRGGKLCSNLNPFFFHQVHLPVPGI